MARPKTVFRTYRDFAHKGKSISELTISELRECMADPSLEYQQWLAIRTKVIEKSDGTVPKADFFEGGVGKPAEVVTTLTPGDLLREQNVAGTPRLVEVDGKMVDPMKMTAKEREAKFGNDNPAVKGTAMSAADYRKFMSEVKG